MSTVPKITYAKIGNKSKNKIESSSTEIPRNDQQSQDLFSHMNKDNLNYIKKQLKLKKNKSTHEKSERYEEQNSQQQAIPVKQIPILTQNQQKIYQKYKKDSGLVSQQQPQYEQTQRKESQVQINIDYQQRSDQEQIEQDSQGRQIMIINSQKANDFKKRQKSDQNRMIFSSPYDDQRKRLSSIEGYFGQAFSTNLNALRQQGSKFIQNLEGYICDLKESSAEINPKASKAKNFEKQSVIFKDKEQVNASDCSSDQILQQDIRKLERLKRNSDTFGQPNSRYLMNPTFIQLQQQLKKERQNSIKLAQQIEKYRNSLKVKDEIISKLQFLNEDLEQQIDHLLKKFEHFNKGYGNKKSVQVSSLSFHPIEYRRINTRQNNQNEAYKSHFKNNSNTNSFHFSKLKEKTYGSNNENLENMTQRNYDDKIIDKDFRLFNDGFKYQSTVKLRTQPKNQSLEKLEKQQNQWKRNDRQFRMFLKKNKSD